MNYKDAIKKISGIDNGYLASAREKLDTLTKPPGSLGRMEEIAALICSMTRNKAPELRNKVIFTFAADHGITDEGISAFPKEVTVQMVNNFLSQGAAINVLGRHAGAKVTVADLGIASDIPLSGLIVKKAGYGTKNMAKEAAMTTEQAEFCLNSGIEILMEEINRGKIDIAVAGDMGIGNTTVSSAITACITKTPAEKVTGRGTGITDSSLNHKIEVINKTLALHNPSADNGLDVLSKIGGFEIGGLAGLMIGCAANRIPVVIDGFNSTAAALIAAILAPESRQYMIAGHCSHEPGHIIQLRHLGLKPILDLQMRLGEGTGGALALGIIEASVKILNEMATFTKAGVSNKL